MSDAEGNLRLDFDTWKVQVKENQRRNVLKLYVKLNKVESIAFKNFMETVKPDNVSENEFMKAIFSMGVESMEGQLIRAVEEKLSASGLDLNGSGAGLVEIIEEDNEDTQNTEAEV